MRILRRRLQPKRFHSETSGFRHSRENSLLYKPRTLPFSACTLPKCACTRCVHTIVHVARFPHLTDRQQLSNTLMTTDAAALPFLTCSTHPDRVFSPIWIHHSHWTSNKNLRLHSDVHPSASTRWIRIISTTLDSTSIRGLTNRPYNLLCAKIWHQRRIRCLRVSTGEPGC